MSSLGEVYAFHEKRYTFEDGKLDLLNLLPTRKSKMPYESPLTESHTAS